MHRISFGEAGNLKDFITALKDDRHFAMDFWAMVGDLSARERGALSDDEMLDALVEGSTGLKITALPLSEKIATAELKNLLAGVDIESPLATPPVFEPAAAEQPAVRPAAADQPLARPEEPPFTAPMPRSSQAERARSPLTEPANAASAPAAAEAPIFPDSRSPYSRTASSAVEAARLPEVSHIPDRVSDVDGGDTPRESQEPEPTRGRISIEQALRRLEETSRELREQLEDFKDTQPVPQEVVESPVVTARPVEPPIERPVEPPVKQEPVQREPWIVVDPPRAEAATAPEAVVVAPIEKPAYAPVERPRQVERDQDDLRRDQAFGRPAPFVPAPRASRQAAFTPHSFGTLSHRGLLPRDADDDPFIAVPLSAYTESNTPGIRWGLVLLALLFLLVGGIWLALHYGYGQDLLDSSRTTLRTKVGLFGQELHDLATPSSSQPQNPQQPASTDNPQSTLKSSQASDASNPQPASPSRSGRHQAAQNSSPDELPPTPANVRPDASAAVHGAVRVSASAMEANLISSRVPVYPEAAKNQEIDGPVVLDIVVSPSGSVEYAHAVSGDSHLRTAAEEAVLKWRYKPYQINGTPVAAATQVRIVFRLP